MLHRTLMPSDQRTHKFGVLGPSIAVLRFSVWGSVGHLGTSLHKASPKTPSILGPNEAAWKPCSGSLKGTLTETLRLRTPHVDLVDPRVDDLLRHVLFYVLGLRVRGCRGGGVGFVGF